MKIKYEDLTFSTELNISDMQYILDNSSDTNILQSIEYVKVWKKLGANIITIIGYYKNIPASLIVGRYLNIFNLARTLSIGGLGGGCPIVTDCFQGNDRLKVQEYTIEQLEKLLKNINVGTVYIYPPLYSDETTFNLIESKGYEKIPDYTPILDISKNVDTLWDNLNKKNRNAIRYALKNNVEIKKSTSKQEFDQFYEILMQTSKRGDFKAPPYKTLLTEFEVYAQKQLCDIWIAKHNEKTISGAFIWKYKNNINYVYGGSLKEGWSIKANNLLHWKIIEEYHQEGYETYNMWGAVKDKSNPAYGVTGFKMKFGCHLIECPKFKKINKKWLSLF